MLQGPGEGSIVMIVTVTQSVTPAPQSFRIRTQVIRLSPTPAPAWAPVASGSTGTAGQLGSKGQRDVRVMGLQTDDGSRERGVGDGGTRGFPRFLI